ncbi:hypothetical protein Prudu_012736, partial [Prunus dulcis]
QEEHPRAVSAVKDGEGHPGDQQSYQHRIRRAASGCTDGGVAYTNYNLEDLDDESLAYVNGLYSERYKQWKSDLHHYFERLMIHKSLFRRIARRSLRGGRIVGRGSALIFRHPLLIKPKSIRAIGRRRLFSIIQVSGPSLIGWMDGGRGSKFPEIEVFGDIYVRPRNELAESLHTTMVERSQLVLQESASQLPPDTQIESVDPPQDAGILMETLDQTLGRRPGTYCQGMGNARQREPRPHSSVQSNSQVTTLIAQVATLQSQMSVILQSLAQSRILMRRLPSPSIPSIPTR